jgi:hypothetical protein
MGFSFQILLLSRFFLKLQLESALKMLTTLSILSTLLVKAIILELLLKLLKSVFGGLKDEEMRTNGKISILYGLNGGEIPLLNLSNSRKIRI